MARVVPPAWSPVAPATLLAALGGFGRGAAAVAALERRLAAWLGAVRAIGTDSGTTALSLAARAAGAGAGSRPVALPAWGCFDLATALDGAGHPVVLYDVDPRTLGPEWGSFGRVVERGVAAAVIVHPFGLPVDAPRAKAQVDRWGGLLIEDAAQGAGALLGGAPVGSFGDLAVLSFGRGKGLTGGGGGALVIRTEEAAARVGRLALGAAPSGLKAAAVLGALLAASSPAVYGLVAALPFLALGSTPYHRPWPPAAIGPVPAAAVLETIGRLEGARGDRTRIAERLRAAARRAAPEATVEIAPRAVPSYLRLPLVLAGGNAPVAAAARLGAMPGYPSALIDLPGFRDRVVNPGDDFTGARRLAAELVTLPTHRWVGERDLAALEQWLTRTLTGAT